MFDPILGAIVIGSLLLLKIGQLINNWLDRHTIYKPEEDDDEIHQ